MAYDLQITHKRMNKTSKNRNRFIKQLVLLILMSIFLLPFIGVAGTYWVSPIGIATWPNCQSSVPLSGTSACPLSTANTNARAGDIVNLRGGIYSIGINPSNSGSEENPITYIAYSDEIPIITGNIFAINIQGKSYIKVKGIKAQNVHMFYFIGHGASYNEISFCIFEGTTTTYYSSALITDFNSAFTRTAATKHNWIHHNIFTRYGNVSNCQDAGTIRISAGIVGGVLDNTSNHTIEKNKFSYGGHDLLDIGGKYNIVRNNVFHNEEAYFINQGGCINNPSSGYFGNRNILVSDYGYSVTRWNLIEGNRAGHAGTPPDDDGAFGIENAGPNTIVRYNYLFGNGAAGYYSKTQNSGNADYARVYNNTIYANGFGDSSIDDMFKAGIAVDCNGKDHPANTVIKNNIIFGNYTNSTRFIGGPYQNCSGEFTQVANYTTDPLFINPDIKNKTSSILPDLRLKQNSPAVDGGIHLTQAVGSGNNSTTLIVDDALYFQDGTRGSDLAKGITSFPDWIAIGSVDNVVEITSIDYSTNTITLKTPMSWNDRAKIWLYKKSDGERVLYGSAPDYGAHEFIPSKNTQSPMPPKNLRFQ